MPSLIQRKRRRLERERRTVETMIFLYCRDHHGGKTEPCVECRALLAYARKRLERCPFGGDKPTCGHCPIHCYQPAMRDKVKDVMRYSGPRLFWRHPLLAICHLQDGRRRPPPPSVKSQRTNE